MEFRSNSKRKIFQNVVSSKLGLLIAVIYVFSNDTPYRSVISNFSVTPTKVKKEKKDENFQSPRKIQSINILRRKRTQVKFWFLYHVYIFCFKGARSAKASAETPTRSRRKQIIWTKTNSTIQINYCVPKFRSSLWRKAPQFIIQ